MSAGEITVVLAHGAWADGSSWARVIEGLRLAGQRAVAADHPPRPRDAADPRRRPQLIRKLT